jgi:hypothetical protein
MAPACRRSITCSRIRLGEQIRSGVMRPSGTASTELAISISLRAVFPDRSSDGLRRISSPPLMTSSFYRLCRWYRRASAILPFLADRTTLYLGPTCLLFASSIPFLEASKIHAAAGLSSLSTPRATILRMSSVNGRCSASPHPTVRASRSRALRLSSGSLASPWDGSSGGAPDGGNSGRPCGAVALERAPVVSG